MKRLGCCTLCDREVFEVVRRYTEGEVAGWPKQVGAPHAEARRVWLVFADGTIGAATLCGECAVTPETLPQVLRRLLG